MTRFSLSHYQLLKTCLALTCFVQVGMADETDLQVGMSLNCQDSLSIGSEDNPDAAKCLQNFEWTPEGFTVSLEAPYRSEDYLVRFPSPVKSQNATNDLVSMEWYVAKNLTGKPVVAPAILVVHESGRSMEVGRVFTQSLREMGLHTCLIHLPHYGARKTGKKPSDAGTFLMRVQQGVADTRRAYDAVKSLPYVNGKVSIQGTSLGGFVAALAGSLDGCYEHVHLLLAGGNLNEMLMNGQKDTAKVRKQLAAQGITGEALKELLHQIEPTRIAHRLKPKNTFLYSARFDTVVPIANADALATAIPLDAKHHIQFPANHYSGVIFIPLVLKNIQTHANSQ